MDGDALFKTNRQLPRQRGNMTENDIKYLDKLIRYCKKAEKAEELVDIDELDIGRFLVLVAEKLRDDYFRGYEE